MSESLPELQIVATFPTGTSLDDYDIPRANHVWIEMIESAESTAMLMGRKLASARPAANKPMVGGTGIEPVTPRV